MLKQGNLGVSLLIIDSINNLSSEGGMETNPPAKVGQINQNLPTEDPEVDLNMTTLPDDNEDLALMILPENLLQEPLSFLRLFVLLNEDHNSLTIDRVPGNESLDLIDLLGGYRIQENSPNGCPPIEKDRVGLSAMMIDNRMELKLFKERDSIVIDVLPGFPGPLDNYGC